ncbi:MAG: lytic polysaccharide monooxygenase, partial [Bacilli bacterium]
MKINKKIVSAVLVSSLLIVPFIQKSSAHGYITESRAGLCKEKINKDCGNVQYEPQSIEAVGGFPESGPADGKIASGGGLFPELDQQSPDRWVKKDIKTGANSFTWTLTAAHATDEWKYYITKPEWNPSKPITRADLELVDRYDGGGARPSSSVTHSITVPENRKGYHVIVGVWEIADTVNAFYQVIDVMVSPSGNETVDKEAPTVPQQLKAGVVTSHSIALNWQASTDNVGVYTYEIYRDGVHIGSSSTPTFNDTKVEANTSYTYKIRALDRAGNASPFSTEQVIKSAALPTVDTDAPTAPANLHSMGETANTVSLMWNASIDNVGVTKYEVFRDGLFVGETTSPTYKDTLLKADTTYSYTVVAVDKANNRSGKSNTLTLKTKKEEIVEGTWKKDATYLAGDTVTYNGVTYTAKWWSKGDEPGKSDVWSAKNVTSTEW